MKQFLLALSLISISGFISIKAQSQPLTKAYKDSTIASAIQLLEDRYVFRELGIKTASYLKELNQKGHFKPYQDLESFASALTKSIYSITYDKHITVSLKQEYQIEDNRLSVWVNGRMDDRKYYRQSNAGVKTFKKLLGNIGYIELRGFYGLQTGKGVIDNVMEMLASSDAIIIDLRNNQGGRADMVHYLVSHFFDSPVATSRTLRRHGERFIETINHTKDIPGIHKMPDTPIFILTSGFTFSAAEAFSYPFKIHKRAILVGETTKGGANAGDLLSVNDELNIFIPDVAGKHPVNDESYDGVGIEPDVKTRSGDALEVAIKLAQKAAEEYKTKNDKKAKSLLHELDSIINNFEKSPESERLIEVYLACRKQHIIFEEWEINTLGYQYLNQEDKLYTAEALFEVNTILYPESANAHDSYAEVLLRKNNVTEAILNYEKAVILSEKFNDDNKELFKNNLAEAKKRLSENSKS